MSYIHESKSHPPVPLNLDTLTSLPNGQTIIPAPIIGNLIQVAANLNKPNPRLEFGELAVTVGKNAVTLTLLDADTFNLQNPNRINNEHQGRILHEDVPILRAVKISENKWGVPHQINQQYQPDLRTAFRRIVRGVRKQRGLLPVQPPGLATYYPPRR